MMSLIYVFIGGGAGSICRYALGQLSIGSLFPLSTLAANIISSLILGLLIGFNSEHIMKDSHRLLLMTGFCGGFSTFSTFSAEIVNLYQKGLSTATFTYIFLSLFLGVLSIVVGVFISRAILNLTH